PTKDNLTFLHIFFIKKISTKLHCWITIWLWLGILECSVGFHAINLGSQSFQNMLSLGMVSSINLLILGSYVSNRFLLLSCDYPSFIDTQLFSKVIGLELLQAHTSNSAHIAENCTNQCMRQIRSGLMGNGEPDVKLSKPIKDFQQRLLGMTSILLKFINIPVIGKKILIRHLHISRIKRFSQKRDHDLSRHTLCWPA